MRAPGATARLATVAHTPDEAAWEQQLENLLRAANEIAIERGARMVLKGGTAARIGYGLTRPSRDIDLDIVGDIDTWSVLVEAGDRAGLIVTAEPQRHRPMKGFLVIHHPDIGSTSLEVDLRRVRDRASIEAITDRDHTRWRHGICMYSAQALARQKIKLVTEPGGRRKGRDRYDIAWWLLNHIDMVPAQLRTRLDEVMHSDPTLKTQWDENHRDDRIMNRVSEQTVHNALRYALDTDIAVLSHRWPQGKATVEIAPRSGATVQWVGTERNPEEHVIVAEFEDDAALETFMVTQHLWKSEEVPQHIRGLEDERETLRRNTAHRTTKIASENDRQWIEATVACTTDGFFVQGDSAQGAAGATRGPIATSEEVLDALSDHAMVFDTKRTDTVRRTLVKLRRQAERTGTGRVTTIEADGTVHAESRKSSLARRLLRSIAKEALSPMQSGHRPTATAAANEALEASQRTRSEIAWRGEATKNANEKNPKM